MGLRPVSFVPLALRNLGLPLAGRPAATALPCSPGRSGPFRSVCTADDLAAIALAAGGRCWARRPRSSCWPGSSCRPSCAQRLAKWRLALGPCA